MIKAGSIGAEMDLSTKGWSTGVRTVNRDMTSMDSRAAGVTKTVGGMGKGFAIAGVAIAAAIGKSISSINDFNKEIANITTLLDDTSASAITNLKSNIRSLSVAAAKDTTDVAQGAYQVISAFGEAAAGSKKLEINVLAAAAGMSTTRDAINLTAAVTKGFGDTSDEAVQKVADLAFTTQKLGVTSFAELSTTVGSAVPLMAALGGNVEELFGVMATLTGVTGNTSEVVTQLTSVMGAFMKPTTAMKKAIADLGYESVEAMIKEKGLVGTIREIRDTTDGTTLELGKLIRRKEALTAVLALTGAQADVFDEKLEKIKQSGGAATVAFEKMSGGVNAAGFAMEQAKVEIQIAGQKIGEVFLPVVSTVVSVLAKIVSGIGDVLNAFPGFTKTFITAATVIGSVVFVAVKLYNVIPKLTAAFVALKATMFTTTTALAGGQQAITGLIGASTVGTTTVTALTTGFKGLLVTLGKVSAIGAAAFIGWGIGTLIRKIKGLDEAVQGVFSVFIDGTIDKHREKIAALAYGYTDLMKKNISINDVIRSMGQNLGSNSDRLSVNAEKIRENIGAYSILSPEIKKTVDGLAGISNLAPASIEAMDSIKAKILELGNSLGIGGQNYAEHATAIKANIEVYNSLDESVKKVVDQLTQAPAVIAEKNAEIISLVNEAQMTIQEAALSETDFKIYQLEREYQADLDLMQRKGATRLQYETVERAHQISLQKIRDTAASEEQKKLTAQYASIRKVMSEAYDADEARIKAHHDFIMGLRQERETIRIADIARRDGERAAELERIRIWEIDQLKALEDRYSQALISTQQYQDQREAIESTAEAKRNQAEITLESERDKRRAERLQKINEFQNNWVNKVTSVLDILGQANQAYTQDKIDNLEAWYEAEKQRIIDNVTDEDERTAALKSLEEQYDQKKKEIQETAQRREKAIAIARVIADTAVGVMKAVASAPWPLNIPAIAFAIGMGAAQLAVLGQAYSGGGVEDYAPNDVGGGGYEGGGENEGGGGQGGQIDTTIGDIGPGGNLPAFAAGTDGYITPHPAQIVGEAGVPELLEFRTGPRGPEMQITPLGDTRGQGGVTFVFSPTIYTIDAHDMARVTREQVAPEMMSLFKDGLLTWERR